MKPQDRTRRLGVKRIFVSLTFVLVAVCAMPFAALGETTSDGYEYTKQNGAVTITGYSGAGGDIVTPSTIDSAPVTAIGDEAFERNSKITSVTVSDGVETIGDEAFNDCTKLTSATLPTSLDSIGDDAFYTCSRLTVIALPEGLESLGDHAFAFCYSLESASIPGTLSDWGTGTFSNCNALTKVTVADGASKIGKKAFYACVALTAVELPASVTEVGNNAFASDNLLTSIDLSHLVTVGDRAFSFSGIQSLDLASVVTIGKEAFQGVAQLSTLNVPCVKSIGENAFVGASGFGVDWGNIGDDTGDGSNTRTDAAALIAAAVAADAAANAGTSYSVNLPASLTSLGEGAFSSCLGGLASVNVDEQNTHYKSVNGVVYSKDGTTLVCVPMDYQGALDLADGVTSIAAHAAENVANLTSITLPDSLTSIGAYAFSGCFSITSVKIPAGVTEIPEQAFSMCSLQSIDIPGTVKKIGAMAFGTNTTATSVTLEEGVQEVDAAAFYKIGKAAISFPASLIKLDPQAISGTVVTSLTFADGCAYKLASDGCSILSADGTKLVTIQAGSDDGLDAVLDEYTIPDGVTTVGKDAFCGASVKKLVVPDSVTTVEDKSIGYTISSTSNSSRTVNKAEKIIAAHPSDALVAYAKKNELALFTKEPAASCTEISLAAGQTGSFVLDGAVDGVVVYASSDNSVASIASDGTVTANAAGEADVFACEGTYCYSAHVTVTGEAASDPYANYTRFTSSEQAKAWSETNTAYNGGAYPNKLDTPGTYIYTTNAYTAVNAFLDSAYTSAAEGNFSSAGYDEYEAAAYNIAPEIANFKLSDNVVLYSGRKYISEVTGGSSTLADAVSCIGKTFSTKAVMSTTMVQSVAVGFMSYNPLDQTMSDSTLYEIYAPKDMNVGADVSQGSYVPDEEEICFANNAKLKVLDAGVRYTENADGTKIPVRYMKLVVVTDDADSGDKTNPDTNSEPKPSDNTDSGAQDKTDAGTTDNGSTQQASTKTSSKTKYSSVAMPKTGDATAPYAVVAAAGVAVLGVGVYATRRPAMAEGRVRKRCRTRK